HVRALGARLRVQQEPLIGAHDLPTFNATNATSAITAITATAPTQTPALKIVPIASQPDVIAPLRTNAMTGTTRLAATEVLIGPPVNEKWQSCENCDSSWPPSLFVVETA